jgi:putative ABC transport system substrate-binding protein
MRRREFLGVLGGSAAAWPLIARAQQGKPARVGILVLGNPDPEPFLKTFRASLREIGYFEGDNIQLDIRSANGEVRNLSSLASELVALKVDIIVTFQTLPATAAKQATDVIPIVMGTVGDPIETGLVASLSRPGGNVTGIASATAELGAKNLEIIHEVLAPVQRVGVLANVNDPFHVPFLEHIKTAARTLNIEIKSVLLRGAEDYGDAFADMARDGMQAVIVQPSLPHSAMASLAIRHHLPAFSPNANFAAAGGLMAYSADYDALYRGAAIFVDKILKGRKPADLPVQLPTKFSLVVNLKTARALGLTLPPSLLTRADHVIE